MNLDFLSYHRLKRYVVNIQGSISSYDLSTTSSNLAINTIKSSTTSSCNRLGSHSEVKTAPQFCSKLTSRQCVYCNFTPVSPFN